MEIRPVRPDELEAVGQLTVAVYVGDGFLAAGDSYVQQLMDTSRRAREAEVWVAVEDGALLGSVTFCPVGSDYREIGHDDEGEFRMLVVGAAARGKGVGRALVELCLTRCRELGYAGVRMSTMSQMDSAHRVYERVGFVRAPDADWSPEPGVALLGYALRLS